MIDAPHEFTLFTTEAPRTERRPRPQLTVERAPRVHSAPRNIPYSGVTLEPISDDEDSAFLADRRADFIRRETADTETEIARIRFECMAHVARAERSYKYGPKAGRAERIERERAAWIGSAEEYIAGLRQRLVTATT